MTKRLIPVLLAWFAIASLRAQTDTLPPPGGIILNDSIFATSGEPEAVTRSSFPGAQKSLLAKTDLTPFNQRCEQACGSCAATGGVMLRQKLHCDAQCKCSAPAQVFSWSFLHNQLIYRYGVQNIHLKTVLDLLTEQGIPLAESFQNTPCSHDSLPNGAHRSAAAVYRYWTYEPIFHAKKSFSGTQKQVDSLFSAQLAPQTIAWIDRGIPVIIGLRINENFRSLASTDCQWRPTGTFNGKMCHAMLVTGYNDQSKKFELFNSYGKKWGCSGIAYISYQDYARVVQEGYVLKFDLEDGRDVLCPH